MSTSTLGLGETLQQYLLDVSLHEPEACLRLREQTLSLPEANMISSPEQVQLIKLLCKMLNTKKWPRNRYLYRLHQPAPDDGHAGVEDDLLRY